MRILIAENDASSRKLLIHLIKALPNFKIVGVASTGEDLIRLTASEKPDLAIVDIGLPLLDGMAAVKISKEILPSLQIIFVTGNDDLALEAFDVKAIDYILKPIEWKRLYGALERALQLFNQANSENKSTPKDLMIKHHNTLEFIPLDEIIFIEREERKSKIHTLSKMYTTSESLMSLEEKLDSRFIASHRSYLINLEFLTKIETKGQMYLAYFKNYDGVAKVSKNQLANLQNRKSI
ncbi:response regulator transcription factor [Bacillus sp. BGMRC 2118]|nr:response regulator transcription factor [Bacillus sp. BGMRC 2118]